MIRILVLCTGNSCRSQMAEGYFRSLAGSDVEVYSAGVETHGLNPYAVRIMAEDGIDISNHTSNNVNDYMDLDFNYIITVCDNAKDRCPYFPAKAEKHHKGFPDPAKAAGSEEDVLDRFREVRDMIKMFVKEFINEKLK